jgi:predicted subunit of tRNA(5-methylaminomethyl-2-thiouridylate) methyltransferase
MIVRSEIRITVEMPASLAVEIGISAHLLESVQRAAYQFVFAPAARNRLRRTICQDIEVAWDATETCMQEGGPAYALEHPHLAALEVVWHKLHEMAAADPAKRDER